MVLLPGCACCNCDLCCQLGRRLASTTSVELDVFATDYELTRTEQVVRLLDNGGLICGKYGIGSLGIAFNVCKGSQINGSYSLSLVSDQDDFLNGLPRRLKIYECIVNNPPYICGGILRVWVYLRRTSLLTIVPPTFDHALDYIFVETRIPIITGKNRASTSIPPILSCSKLSTCGPNNDTEQNGSFGYSQSPFYGSSLGIYCNSSFQLSSVANSSSHIASSTPIGDFGSVFGRTSSDEKGTSCGQYVEGITTASLTVGFSNLVIP